jgi:hypothetical protein
MRKIWIICSILGLFFLGPVVLLSGEAKAMEETISGRSYRAIQVAAVEFARHNLDISRYRIAVATGAVAKTSIFVTFIDADAPDDPRFRGNPGKIPGFAVELNRDDLRVIRANFIR